MLLIIQLLREAAEAGKKQLSKNPSELGSS